MVIFRSYATNYQRVTKNINEYYIILYRIWGSMFFGELSWWYTTYCINIYDNDYQFAIEHGHRPIEIK